MKKAPNPNILQSNREKQGSDSPHDHLPGKISDLNQHKTSSVKSYFTAASRKLAGFFTTLHIRKTTKATTDVNNYNTNNQAKTSSCSKFISLFSC